MDDNIRQICEENERKWCILRHPDSEKIAKIFRGKAIISTDMDHPNPPFDFYIPAEEVDKDMLRFFNYGARDDITYDPVLDEDALRRDLSHFIFLCADAATTEQIVSAPWARSLRHRIQVYRNRNRRPVEISGVSVFNLSCVVRQQGFLTAMSHSDSSYQEIRDGETVRVINGPMAGRQGVVTAFVEQDGQLLLTLRMEMFENQLPIDVPGFNIFDVRALDDHPSDGDLQHTPLIASFENRIIEYLSHLHGRSGSQQRNQADRHQLRTILSYAGLKFSTPEEQTRFQAMMLLCAYLLNDKDETAHRQQQVEQLLQGRTAPASPLDCYLFTVLFIVTHRHDLRRQYKSWLQSHPDSPVALRRFHAIAKLIHC